MLQRHVFCMPVLRSLPWTLNCNGSYLQGTSGVSSSLSSSCFDLSLLFVCPCLCSLRVCLSCGLTTCPSLPPSPPPLVDATVMPQRVTTSSSFPTSQTQRVLCLTPSFLQSTLDFYSSIHRQPNQPCVPSPSLRS